MEQGSIQHALKVFEISDSLTIDRLNERYRQLLFTWHPHRYANLTNNPRKYMEMYKKGEAHTKEIHAAFTVLKAWLEEPRDQSKRAESNPSITS